MLRDVFFGIVVLGFLSFSSLVSAQQTIPIDLPASEISIINDVADQYGLEGDARLLLFIIRKIENGRPGYAEFGVLHPRAIGRGFRVQCEWAAGTLRKRYNGDLQAFAERWCPSDAHPLNRNWYTNAMFYMKKWGAYAGS
jgi:hypothetical protein